MFTSFFYNKLMAEKLPPWQFANKYPKSINTMKGSFN